MSGNGSTPTVGTPRPTIRMGEVGRFLVPVDQEDIVAWFLRHLFLGQSFRERLAITAGAGPRPGWLGRLVFDRCWTLEPPLGAAPAGGAPEGREDWAPLLARSGAAFSTPGSPLGTPPDPGRCIFVRDRRGTGRGHLIAFVFGARGRGPIAVAKIRLATSGSPALRAEWDALRRLRARLPTHLASGIPRPMAYRRRSGVDVLVEAPLPGRSGVVELYESLNPRRLPCRHLDAALGWIMAFQEGTSHGEQRYQPPRHLLGDGGIDEPPWLLELRERCARAVVPGTAVHGDFRIGNILLRRRAHYGQTPQVGVVDWERFRPLGSPFTDVFDLAITYALGFPWSRSRRWPPLRAFRLGFLEENAVSRELRAFLVAYCERTGTDPRLLESLARVHLLERARQGPNPDIWLQLERLLARAERSIVSAP